ncbi:lysophospholipid acyltransferase family protein [Nitratifractor sp.]
MELNVEAYLRHHHPSLKSLPGLSPILRGLFHERRINAFLREHAQDDAFAFVESVIEYMGLEVILNKTELARIPSEGRALVVANHPLGTLDAMALIDLIREVRSDIKILANSFLYTFENLREILIPVDNITGRLQKSSLQAVYRALEREEMVIVFPSGEVSRAGLTGIKDAEWERGFYRFASRYRAPIVPIYIEAKNSTLFYALSLINKKIGTILLPHEMMRYENRAISFKIGRAIPYEAYALPSLSEKETVKLLRKHFYRIARGKKPIFKTAREIALPEERSVLKSTLKSHARELGKTFDGKTIYLYANDKKDAVFREIGRLREISFRSVGEGSGKKRDIDTYDYLYRHLIIWDDEALEIAGAYRIGICEEILPEFGIEGLYTSTLFRFDEEFDEVLLQSIELGRSFVQPRYRNSRALDYLWQGIGAYVRENPNLRYLFGPVSISASYSPEARELLVAFYDRFFGARKRRVHHKYPYRIPPRRRGEIDALFDAQEYREAIRTLRAQLEGMGYTVPTLYKQYTEVTEPGGSLFHDFGIDPDFGDCIDGLIVVDLHRLKPSKRKRYLQS